MQKVESFTTFFKYLQRKCLNDKRTTLYFKSKALINYSKPLANQENMSNFHFFLVNKKGCLKNIWRQPFKNIYY
jgi:hypothetical protein